jgi:glycosyltransferase involved in cell wall biosynthesis
MLLPPMPVTFTVAIPTHDRRDTVVLALRSILDQTRAPEQVIVLCDGCTDGTQDAARALGDSRIEVLDLPKAPGYGYDHRNRALERARGEAILWFGDDDLMLPEHLEAIGATWDAGDLDLVQTYAVHVRADDTLEWLGRDWTVPQHRHAVLTTENTTPMGSVCVRVETARAAGGWDGTVPRLGDWDLWKRVLSAGVRTANTAQATHLHFRATQRAQAWPERVAQNRRWLSRVHDSGELARLRAEIGWLRGAREGLEYHRIKWLEAENQRLRDLLAQVGLTS